MRTRQEKDEQTLEIATALFGAAILWSALLALAWIFQPGLGGGGLLLLVGATLSVTGLVRMWRRAAAGRRAAAAGRMSRPAGRLTRMASCRCSSSRASAPPSTPTPSSRRPRR